MALRLFIFVDGNEVATMSADIVPRVGEALWFKTHNLEMTVEVDAVEHQLDRSRADTYATHDVCLYCHHK